MLVSVSPALAFTRNSIREWTGRRVAGGEKGAQLCNSDSMAINRHMTTDRYYFVFQKNYAAPTHLTSDYLKFGF